MGRRTRIGQLGWTVLSLATVSVCVVSPAHAAVCEAVAAIAEREAGLPPNLLVAIGRVEAGRRNPISGGRDAWPWSVNSGGQGRAFATADQAVAYVQALLARGVRSIDTGCFQVNLAWHADAFASVAEAFDPAANARAAARFLLSLQAQTGDWAGAVARYHSATAALGTPYRALVFATWAEGAAVVALAPRRADPVVVRTSAAAQRVHVFYGAIEMPGWRNGAVAPKSIGLDRGEYSADINKPSGPTLASARLY